MGDLTGVDRVVQHLVKVAARERQPAAESASILMALGDQPEVIGFLFEKVDAAQLQVEGKHLPDHLGLGSVDHQLLVSAVITEGYGAAHPHALPFRGGDLVTDPLAGDLALELGEGKQHVEGQPPHRGGGTELLGDRHQRNLVRTRPSAILWNIYEISYGRISIFYTYSQYVTFPFGNALDYAPGSCVSISQSDLRTIAA